MFISFHSSWSHLPQMCCASCTSSVLHCRFIHLQHAYWRRQITIFQMLGTYNSLCCTGTETIQNYSYRHGNFPLAMHPRPMPAIQHCLITAINTLSTKLAVPSSIFIFVTASGQLHGQGEHNSKLSMEWLVEKHGNHMKSPCPSDCQASSLTIQSDLAAPGISCLPFWHVDKYCSDSNELHSGQVKTQRIAYAFRYC